MDDKQDPIHYIEAILKEGSEAIESYKESSDLTKIIGFTQRCIPRLDGLEIWAKNEDFMKSLKTYTRWIAKHDVDGHEYVVVEIDKIDWKKEIVHWHNTTEDYPIGGSTFSSFKEEFFPWRDLK